MEKGDEKVRKTAKQSSGNIIEIDCVIFNFEDENLKVLLVKQKENPGNVSWRLASDYIKKNETMSSTAQNILEKYIGGNQFFLKQLKAFGYSSQSSLQEDISIGYYALVKRGNMLNETLSDDVKWIGIHEITGLNDRHKTILDYSVKELRKNICSSAIGFNLLPEKFTLLQVIHLYEEILNIEINKSNFRRKLFQMDLVNDSNEKEEDVSHRAARFYSLNLKKDEMLAHKTLDFNFYGKSFFAE
ncbi:NUDIX hydrolase [uncultured Flavobacterium sp.]|uniref:NUDIX hydrolase n=1 Tax=uncultured Flavobacterium sp. TaxID=165435 RepID=UPI00292EF584|nr:NUDIX hydrolase [uncultured Flavobacterium sp.]